MSLESDIDYVTSQVSERTPDIIIESIIAQLARKNEAKKRIEDEGIVVRDLKGGIVPHPAIKIEQDATKMLSDLLWKHKE